MPAWRAQNSGGPARRVRRFVNQYIANLGSNGHELRLGESE